MAGNNDGHTPEMRDVFGQTLVELGREYPNMIVLDADLHTSSKAGYFKNAYPDRFIQVGIAEQNLFGIAAGLALTGFIPFPSHVCCVRYPARAGPDRHLDLLIPN